MIASLSARSWSTRSKSAAFDIASLRGRRAVEVAVDRHRAAEGDVWPVHGATPLRSLACARDVGAERMPRPRPHRARRRSSRGRRTRSRRRCPPPPRGRPPANAHAAAPSRGPHPPMLSGIDPASTAMSATAASRSGDASTPTAMHATTKVATCPRITIERRGEHPDDGSARPERRPEGAQLAADRRTGTRADSRCDDQSDAGDGDRQEHDAHSGSVMPTSRSTPAPPPRGRAARACPAVRSATTARDA